MYKRYPFWNKLYSENNLTPTRNVLSPSLNNCNATVHPTSAIMNAARIDGADKFLFYKQGLTPNVARLITDVDNERINICKKLGISNMETVNHWLYNRYDLNCDDLYAFFQNSVIHSGVPGPQTLQHRFLQEDIVTGLMPMCDLGQLLNLPTPNMQSIIQISRSLLPNYPFDKNCRLLKDSDQTLYHLLLNQKYDQINQYLFRGKITNFHQDNVRKNTRLSQDEINEFNDAGILHIGKIFDHKMGS